MFSLGKEGVMIDDGCLVAFTGLPWDLDRDDRIGNLSSTCKAIQVTLHTKL
jgi:hypothetical protein